MNARQYAQIVGNRRDAVARPIGQPSWAATQAHQRDGRALRSPVDSLLRRATRQLRQRQVAQRAWESLAHPTWLADTGVFELREDPAGGTTIVIAVRDSATGFEIGRQRAQLERALVAVVPGSRRVQFVSADPATS